MTTPEPMRVDPEHLINAARHMEFLAGNIPQLPEPLTVGTGPMSAAIHAELSKFEDPLRTGLPALKAAALKTAQNMGEAGRRYQQADDDMAKQIQDRTALPGQGGAGGAGSGGGAGGGGGMEQLSQLMSMPMQLAGQMAQIPMQAMGALGSLPQGVMQGVQQMAQMGGGKGEKPGEAADAAKREAEEKRAADERREAEEKAKAEEQKKAGAAPAQQGGERAPVTPAQPAPAPAPRHARPAEPSINL